MYVAIMKKKEKIWKYKSESERALHVTLQCHKRTC